MNGIVQVLIVPDLSKFRNAVLTCKEMAKDKSGDKWCLGKPGDVFPEDLWAFCKTCGIGHASDELTVKARCVDLYQYLWFIMGRWMWKKHLEFFEEHI